MIKKYYLCDILTGLEIILALALFIKAVTKNFSDSALWIFVAAELADAADGPCARKWPYPERFNKCFHRRYVKQIEHASDIFLLVSCMIYLYLFPNFFISCISTFGGAIIIAFCIVVELIIRDLRKPYYWLTVDKDKRIRQLILIRRYAYLTGIAISVALLIFSTSYPLIVKITFCLLGIDIGVILFLAKPDRAKNP